jgi:hypothetical protein
MQWISSLRNPLPSEYVEYFYLIENYYLNLNITNDVILVLLLSLHENI